MTFSILKYRIGIEFRTHKRQFTALGASVSKKFGDLAACQKVKGNTILAIGAFTLLACLFFRKSDKDKERFTHIFRSTFKL